MEKKMKHHSFLLEETTFHHNRGFSVPHHHIVSAPQQGFCVSNLWASLVLPSSSFLNVGHKAAGDSKAQRKPRSCCHWLSSERTACGWEVWQCRAAAQAEHVWEHLTPQPSSTTGTQVTLKPSSWHTRAESISQEWPQFLRSPVLKIARQELKGVPHLCS